MLFVPQSTVLYFRFRFVALGFLASGLTYAASCCIWFTSKHVETQRAAQVPCVLDHKDHDDSHVHFTPPNSVFGDVVRCQRDRRGQTEMVVRPSTITNYYELCMDSNFFKTSNYNQYCHYNYQLVLIVTYIFGMKPTPSTITITISQCYIFKY